ncbi:MAG: alanine racemase, partial [Clostridia bacterium]|nr:alanine racemase [Clostridia bacterium]
MEFSYLDRNINGIRTRIEDARTGASRDDAVTLVVAAKSGTVEEINYFHRACGVNDIGENRVQQLLERYEKLDREGLRIHFIGHLQTNKVKYIIDKVHMIHSLDSERLAEEIQRQAQKHGIVMKVLVEINAGREESKSGIHPEAADEFLHQIAEMQGLKLR